MNSKLKQLIDSKRSATVRIKELTKDQQDFLVLCRHHDQPVPYPDMEALWAEAGWGVIKENSLRRHYQNIKRDANLFSAIIQRLEK